MLSDQSFTLDPNSTTVVWQDNVNLAGYIGVNVQSASNTTYVEVMYVANGVNYDNNVTVGTSGTAYFPVLPGAIEIVLGNTDTVINEGTATAIYYY